MLMPTSFVINNKYEILNKLGNGSFGSIYKAVNIHKSEFVAIKVERINSPFKMLKNESYVYNHLGTLSCIPAIKWFGHDEQNYYMVVQLLGPSLKDVLINNGAFSKHSSLTIAVHILSIIQYIHSKGFIHRDIKLDNFLFKNTSNFNMLYVIDFGLCTHIPRNKTPNKTTELIGSPLYASLNAHNKIELHMRDDIISLFYMTCHLELGTLPWLNDNQMNDIIEKKKNLNGLMNSIFYRTLLNCYAFEFNETPNYTLIKRRLLENSNVT